ncbi:Membrane protein, partial [Globisporangium splendens]
MARMTRARREALARFGAMFLTYSEDPSPPSSPLSSEGKVNSIEAIDGSASSVEIASVTTNVVLVADENPPNVVTMANGGSAVCEDPPSELLGVRVDPAAGENPRASIQDNECESPLPVQSCANRRTRRLRIVESDSEEETKSAESQCHECVPSQVSGKRRRAPIFDESSDDSEDNWLPMEHVGGSHKRSQRSRHQAAVETSDDSDPEFVASLLAPEDVGQSASADIDTEGLYIFLRANDYRLKIVNGVEVEQFHVHFERSFQRPSQERFDEAALSTSRIPVQDLLLSMSGDMEGVDVPLGPAVPETVELTNEYFPHLSSYEWSALERMRNVIGEAAVISLLRSASPEDQKNAAVSFMHHEIIESRKQVATPVSSFRTVPLKLDVSPYRGGENEPLSRWFVELDAAITARQLRDPMQRVLFAMSNLAGRAKSWAYGKRLSDPNCFYSYEDFKAELKAAFEPPQSEFRARAEFLKLRQGRFDLHSYAQRARFLGLKHR